MNPDKQKAIFYAKKSLAQIITDVVNLEDINYTIPEVQTLLDGITVGGHTIQDEQITLNQIKAWRFLFKQLEENTVELAKAFVLQLHNLVACGEALTWGEFRTGQVTIAGTKYMPPLYTELDEVWLKLVEQINAGLGNNKQNEWRQTYLSAFSLFAQMARTQFFFDGNKRTARMMMSAVLLSHGYPMVNVPASRKTEFNRVMIDYYNSENLTRLNEFLFSCLDEWIYAEFN